MPELKKFNLESQSLSSKGSDVVIERGGEELGVGLSEGTVRRVGVEALRHNRPPKRTTFAEKKFDAFPREPLEQIKMTIKHILKNHALLKHHKLPTIPTIRADESDMSALYMTDLTRGGASEVYSTPDWMIGRERRGKLYGNKETISITNVNELSQRIADLYRKLVYVGCGVLNDDAFFLVIDKESRIAKIILGDLHNIEFASGVFGDTVMQNYQIFCDFLRGMNKHLSTESQLQRRYIDRTYEELLKEIQEKKSEAGDDAISAG